MTTKYHRFFAGFSAVSIAAAIVNFGPYLWYFESPNTDGIVTIGFPFTYAEWGGFAYRNDFDEMALATNVILAHIVAIVVGYLCTKAFQGDCASS